MNLYLNECRVSLKKINFSVITGPSLIDSARTAPGWLLVPLTISSLTIAGCHLSKLSKSLTVAQTLSAGALMVVVSTTLSCFGGPAKTRHGVTMAANAATAKALFIVDIPCENRCVI